MTNYNLSDAALRRIRDRLRTALKLGELTYEKIVLAHKKEDYSQPENFTKLLIYLRSKEDAGLLCAIAIEAMSEARDLREALREKFRGETRLNLAASERFL